MSGEEEGRIFLERADAFIRLANEQTANAEVAAVSSSLLYAAARFNAFVVFSTTASAEEMSEARREAVEYFSRQYLEMFEEHFDDHVANFARYRGSAG